VIIYPAIDIRGGRCVRLVEGDFNRETAFDADPSDAARRWATLGAEWLHVVDLDGAVAGKPLNSAVVGAIRASVDLPIQLGGGLRTLDALEAAFLLGIDRAILGSAALRSPDLVAQAVERWPGKIAVGLDARDGNLAADGWLQLTDLSPKAVARELSNVGVDHFIFTDIGRDGTLAGPNLDALTDLISSVDANVIASGGVGDLQDVEAIQKSGAAGAIIGRALYDGRVDLAEAIAATRATETVS
jgi:phosphoribosylformimino-5-aminoimidazole carboxamide ribotide isomerase